jgi:hypothetical protein
MNSGYTATPFYVFAAGAGMRERENAPPAVDTRSRPRRREIMRRLIVGVLVAAAVVIASTAPAAAHNAGCVQTGNGDWVFVGSNKSGPFVPEQNPNRNTTPGGDFGRLDLQPEGPGDQYGARHAADQGNSAVQRPSPALCTR